MGKKRKKVDQFLQSRKQSQEIALEEKTQLSNRFFRASVGVVMVLLMLAVAAPARWTEVLGLGVLLGLVSILGSLVVSRLSPWVFPGPAKFNQFVLVVMGAICVYKLILLYGWPVYCTPLPLVAMVVGMAYHQVAATFVVLGLAFFLALMAPAGAGLVGAGLPIIHFPLAVVLSIGGVVSVLGVARVRKQSRPVLVGMYSGLLQAAAIICLQLVGREGDLAFRDLSDPGFFRDPFCGFLSGVVCGGIVTSFLPAIESFFQVVTERRLLDLADPSHKLLRVLRERAPGTFQHTLGVQQLARAAAEAIDADVLLTEVGAYYHDIGKIFKPEYFVENMGEDRTIHDRLRPSMSKMIIISHVKDGMLLAREERLPQQIIDMIPMHHGTTVVEFFYRKARKQSGEEETPGEDVSYRYPGPRPRFAEAGILMLADVVEAIAKTMAEPTSNRFRDMVREVIMRRLQDGQFDLCNLTIADFRKIEDSFVRTLTNMYHSRINYDDADADDSGDVDVNETTTSLRAGRTGARPRRATRPIKTSEGGAGGAEGGVVAGSVRRS